VTSPRPLLYLGSVAFFHAGAVQALYGPSFASLQARFGVDVAEVGGSVAAHFGGAFVGVLLPSLLLVRFGYRWLMVAAAGLMAVGAGGVATAPVWWAALAASFVVGVGYGLSVVLYNLLLARVFGRRGAMAVNLINGAFGIGAVASPALVGWASGALGVGASALTVTFGGAGVLAALVALLASRAPAVPPPQVVAGGAARWAAVPVAATALFAVMFFVYVAVEVSTAAWAPTHLAERVGPARAALAASLFWGAMTVGRFVAAVIGSRVAPAPMVVGASLVGLAGMLLAAVPALTLAGYALAGLALGPVFPTSIAWLQQRFGPLAERVGPVVIASGNLGPVLGAPAVGLAVAALGVASIPLVLAGVVAALLVLAMVAALQR
jgi:MFS transporter, FHS family, glucose/mannose:H+ symporter